MNKKDSPVDGEKNEWFCGKKRRVVLGAGRRVMSNEKGGLQKEQCRGTTRSWCATSPTPVSS